MLKGKCQKWNDRIYVWLTDTPNFLLSKMENHKMQNSKTSLLFIFFALWYSCSFEWYIVSGEVLPLTEYLQCFGSEILCQKIVLNLILAMLIKLMPLPLKIFSQSDNLIQVVHTKSNVEWQTVQIQISWLLDLHCLQRQGISGFSRTRVNGFNSCVFSKIYQESKKVVG